MALQSFYPDSFENFSIKEFGVKLSPNEKRKIQERLSSLEQRTPMASKINLKFQKSENNENNLEVILSIMGSMLKLKSAISGRDALSMYEEVEKEIDANLLDWKKSRFKRNNELISVIGKVTPISWDKKGHPIRFSIYTFDEEDLIIENSILNRKLTTLLNKTVEARGSLYTKNDGTKCMKVIKVQEMRGPGTSSIAPLQLPRDDDWFDEYSVNIPIQETLLKEVGY